MKLPAQDDRRVFEFLTRLEKSTGEVKFGIQKRKGCRGAVAEREAGSSSEQQGHLDPLLLPSCCGLNCAPKVRTLKS